MQGLTRKQQRIIKRTNTIKIINPNGEQTPKITLCRMENGSCLRVGIEEDDEESKGHAANKTCRVD